MDNHAQAEIREYATTIGEQIVKPLFPNVWQAFLDYRLNALTLTGPEVKAIKWFLEGNEVGPLDRGPIVVGWNKREATEFHAKLERLGL